MSKRVFTLINPNREISKRGLMEDEIRKLEKIASEIDYQEGFNGRLTKYRTQKLLENCKGDSVLDLGCAEGTVTGVLNSYFKNVVAVDGSFHFLSRSRKRFGTNVPFFVQSAFEQIEFMPQSFDTIVMSYILEHVADPVSILKRAARWLNKGGRLVILVPHAGSLHRRIGVALNLIKRFDELNELDRSAGHRRVYTRKLLRSHLEQAGLHILKIEDFFLKPFSNAQLDKFDNSLCDALFEVGSQLPGFCSELLASATDK